VNPSLTVVLPVRNAELTLRRHVTEVLELASELTSRVTVLVVDDASQDDTYDTARELAARYPQLRVMRNSRQRGLGPTLKSLRTLVKSDVVVVHDGTSSINADEIRALWAQHQQRQSQGENTSLPRTSQVTIDDLRQAASGHAAMAMAHSRLLGFQLLSTDSSSSAPQELARRTASREKSVGAIPHLPRPNFLSSLANFALGE
jgi:cellulose synthase/poly-beta-1,6-N-acetylglucosamine synthase-like glycosyltransferase